jgi:hypothetical protein
MPGLEDALRQGWLSLLTTPLECAIRPTEPAGAHASGPSPYRLLLLGGGAAIGLGVSRHDRALPGHLARHLAAITGRGVDVDVTARVGMSLTEARAEVDGRDVTRYDAVVLTLGNADALAALPARLWRARLEPLLTALLSATSPQARVLMIGAHSSAWSPYLIDRVTRLPGRRLAEYNRISRELCWALPRTSYLAPISRHSSDVTQYSVLDYERIGRAIAGHLAQRLAHSTPFPAGPDGRAAPGDPALPGVEPLEPAPGTLIDRAVARARSAFGVEGATVAVLPRTRSRDRPDDVERAGADSGEQATLLAASAQRGGIAIRNLQEDPRFRDSLVARTQRMAFYAGYPICAPAGRPVAVLAIFDPHPRTFSGQEMSVLRDHALLIERVIARSPEGTPPAPGDEPGPASPRPALRAGAHVPT